MVECTLQYFGDDSRVLEKYYRTKTNRICLISLEMTGGFNNFELKIFIILYDDLYGTTPKNFKLSLAEVLDSKHFNFIVEKQMRHVNYFQVDWIS